MQLQNIQISGGITFIPEILTPSGDPYWANVSLLMNTTSANAQTNNTFLDSSTNNFTVTRVGSATQGSFTPFTVAPNTSYNTSTNGGSGYFNGSSSLSASSNAAFAFGTGNFTVEFWMYPTSVSTTQAMFDLRNPDNQNAGFAIYLFGSNLYVGTANINYIVGATTLTNNTWYHVALSRTSTTSMALYLNGVQQGSTYTTSQNFTNSIPKIGSGATGNFNGYLSSTRIVKGTAVYTSAFTPPTSPLTAISGTSLLLNFTNAGIFDSATKNNLATVGDAKVSTTQSKFAPTSVVFDGTGDYLLSSSSSIFQVGLSDFTLEGWINVPNTSGVKGVMGTHNSPFGGGYGVYINNNIPTGQIWTTGVFAADTATGPTITANTWNHIALVKSSGNIKIYVNGIGGNSVSSSRNSNNTSQFYIGAYEGITYLYHGYIQDVRITKGIARYTADFTPPTTAFPTN